MDTTSEINRQLLECPVCCENYNDDARVPRAILCGHSFCTTCLKKMLRDKNITCPLCQAVHAVRDGDVNSIPKDNTRRHLMDILNKKCTRQICTQCEDNNKAVKFCQDCEEYICNECTYAHKRTKLTKNHKLMALEQDKDTNLECNSEVEMKPVLCKNEKHGNKQVLLFCLNCSEDICENCAKERHKEHQIKQLKELYSEKRNELNVLISGFTQADLQNVTKRLEEKIEEVKEKGMSLKSGLTRQFETYGEIIADRLNEIKSQVDEAFGNVTKGLENDKDLVWNMQRKLSEADVLTHERNPASFLKSSQCMVETLTDLQRKISKLPEVVEVRFSQACTTEDFQKIVHALGSIQELRQENSDGYV
ncbi:transcription intermediary factor 1-beta-like [Mercenaria mercenaria]|uniref:transcription intermediary factor 1-beta-like n=1 Tax=Mercenaria mercenaria TaxID=6596 RepID=UPI00234F53F5|nr:transcription intermediary factor 1-beta-like [Mercenaria mercenaria]